MIWRSTIWKPEFFLDFGKEGISFRYTIIVIVNNVNLNWIIKYNLKEKNRMYK